MALWLKWRMWFKTWIVFVKVKLPTPLKINDHLHASYEKAISCKATSELYSTFCSNADAMELLQVAVGSCLRRYSCSCVWWGKCSQVCFWTLCTLNLLTTVCIWYKNYNAAYLDNSLYQLPCSEMALNINEISTFSYNANQL